METIKVRYGESFDLSVQSDDLTSETVTLYIGREGEPPIITLPATFNAEGVAYISSNPDDTKIPLGTYKYQLTVTLEGNRVHKYPTREYCEDNGLPEFVVLEALDETELVS